MYIQFHCLPFSCSSTSQPMSANPLQVEILALDPRKNPSTGKCYGANSQGTPGYPGTVPNTQGTNFTDTAIIIYEVVSDESGDWGYPVYQVKSPQFIAFEWHSHWEDSLEMGDSSLLKSESPIQLD